MPLLSLRGMHMAMAKTGIGHTCATKHALEKDVSFLEQLLFFIRIRAAG
jgi:hypothetical protein